jgi:DNA-binding NtrC family response regulator
LAKTFLERFSKEAKIKPKTFSRQALEFMLSYSWPGNVRELSNRVQKAVVLSENRLISVSDLGFDTEKTAFKIATLDAARQKAELETIKKCLAINNNNVSRTARHLGISRMTMYRLISKLNL